jgi:hypothetical protein
MHHQRPFRLYVKIDGVPPAVGSGGTIPPAQWPFVFAGRQQQQLQSETLRELLRQTSAEAMRLAGNQSDMAASVADIVAATTEPLVQALRNMARDTNKTPMGGGFTFSGCRGPNAW